MYPHPYPLHILILNILDILEKGLSFGSSPSYLQRNDYRLQLELGHMPLLPWVWRQSVQRPSVWETECPETECPGTECPGD